MSDLIRRSDVIKVLEECHLDKQLFEKDVFEKINAIPTAYDVSKVVAELEGKKDEASIEASKRSVRIGEDEYEDDPYYEGKKHAYVHAIEIVRGGKDD